MAVTGRINQSIACVGALALALRLAARRPMVRAQPAMRATPTMSPIMIPDMNPISSLYRSSGSRTGGRKKIVGSSIQVLLLFANAPFGGEFSACSNVRLVEMAVITLAFAWTSDPRTLFI